MHSADPGPLTNVEMGVNATGGYPALLQILLLDVDLAIGFSRGNPILKQGSLLLPQEHGLDIVFLILKAVGRRCFSLCQAKQVETCTSCYRFLTDIA